MSNASDAYNSCRLKIVKGDIKGGLESFKELVKSVNNSKNHDSDKKDILSKDDLSTVMDITKKNNDKKWSKIEKELNSTKEEYYRDNVVLYLDFLINNLLLNEFYNLTEPRSLKDLVDKDYLKLENVIFKISSKDLSNLSLKNSTHQELHNKIENYKCMELLVKEIDGIKNINHKRWSLVKNILSTSVYNISNAYKNDYEEDLKRYDGLYKVINYLENSAIAKTINDKDLISKLNNFSDIINKIKLDSSDVKLRNIELDNAIKTSKKLQGYVSSNYYTSLETLRNDFLSVYSHEKLIDSRANDFVNKYRSTIRSINKANNSFNSLVSSKFLNNSETKIITDAKYIDDIKRFMFNKWLDGYLANNRDKEHKNNLLTKEFIKDTYIDMAKLTYSDFDLSQDLSPEKDRLKLSAMADAFNNKYSNILKDKKDSKVLLMFFDGYKKIIESSKINHNDIISLLKINNKKQIKDDKLKITLVDASKETNQEKEKEDLTKNIIINKNNNEKDKRKSYKEVLLNKMKQDNNHKVIYNTKKDNSPNIKELVKKNEDKTDSVDKEKDKAKGDSWLKDAFQNANVKYDLGVDDRNNTITNRKYKVKTKNSENSNNRGRLYMDKF